MTIVIHERVAKILSHLNSNEVQVETSTVREALKKLGEIVPFYSGCIRDGKAHRAVRWEVNDVDIEELEGLDTPLTESDVLVALNMVPYDIG